MNCTICQTQLLIDIPFKATGHSIISCPNHKMEMTGYFSDNRITTMSIVIDKYCLTIGIDNQQTILSKTSNNFNDFKIIKIIKTAVPIPKNKDDFLKKIKLILTYM